MLKMLVFWWLLLPASLSLPVGSEASFDDCPAVSGLQKTGETATTFSMTWTGGEDATEYQVWFVRESDHFSSPVETVSGTSHTFSNLQPGCYTFYVAAVCGQTTSGFVGIMDLIES